MQDISLAGIIIAVVAVFAAYGLGYVNGVARGRDKGYNDGKRDGAQEGTVHAFAAGFDRGKRARDDEDDDDEEGDKPDHGEGSNSNLGWAVLAVAAGFLAIMWLSSQTPPSQTPSTQTSPTSMPNQAPRAKLPRVAPLDVLDRPRPSPETSPPGYPPLTETVTLPRVNRTLPTATPVPADGPQQPDSLPAENNGSTVEFPHPPPAFGQPR